MKIVIFQPMLKQYRAPLFERMGKLLAEKGHQLRVVCGSPPPHELHKGDNVITNGPFWKIENSRWLLNGKLHYLPNALLHCLWGNLIVTEQANKHFHNYCLVAARFFGLKRFAYWGHGQNRQGDPDDWREKIKKKLATYCDWWFVYTEGVAGYVANLGYPIKQITVLNNSIDTLEFKRLLAKQTPENIKRFKEQWRIDAQKRIGLYCGGLYPDKNLKFLLNAAIAIQRGNSAFVLLIIGAGQDLALVEDFAERHAFIKYLGPLFGEEKALAFKSAELFLCPGLVGLAILDAFSAGLPLLTCDIPHHSPEIEYLKNGLNGFMTAPKEEDFAQTAIELLAAPKVLAEMQDNALQSSCLYSIENMARNFVEGIQDFYQSIAG